MKRQPFYLPFCLSLLICLLLVACATENEPNATPILPPPNISGGDGAGTNLPTAVATTSTTTELGQLPTGTAVSDDSIDETLDPTPTLEPTATLTPTPAATAVTDPPTEAANSSQLPPTQRDLLFLADGALKRWNHNNRQIETLLAGPAAADRTRDDNSPLNPVIGDITAFSVSADGKRAAVAQLVASEIITTTNAAGEQLPTMTTQHQLLFVDLVSRESWTLVGRVNNLQTVSLSPNAQHLAFIGTNLTEAPTLDPNGQPLSHIYFLPTGGGNAGAVTNAAACGTFCSAIAWHTDNNLFVWHDEEGVWMRNLSGSQPEKLIQNRSFGTHTSDTSQVTVYSPVAWANNGRYLLLWKAGWEGGRSALFDVPTQTLVDIPDSFSYLDDFPVEVSWMADGRLLLLRSETNDGSGRQRPQLELWRFQPDQQAVVKEESLLLSTESLAVAGAKHLENGRFAYALFYDQPYPAAGIYQVVSFSETPERLNASPAIPFVPHAVAVTWAADGSGAIIVPNGGWRIYYSPATGERLYDVTAVLGAEPHAFHW